MADLVITLGSSFRTQLYQDGAPVLPPTGGGDTGGGDTGPQPVTYSTETEALISTIESSMYTGDVLTIYNSDLVATDYTIVKDLNTVTTLEDTFSAVSVGNDVIEDPYTYWTLASSDVMYSYSSNGDTVNGSFMPLFQIDEATIFGLNASLVWTYRIGDNSNGYILYSNDGSGMYPEAPFELNYVNVTDNPDINYSNWYDTQNNTALATLLSQNETDGTLLILFEASGGGGYSNIIYNYNGGSAILKDDYGMEVSGTIHQVDEFDFDQTGAVSADHNEGDYIVVWNYQYNYMSMVFTVDGTGVYYQVQNDYMYAYTRPGWNNDYYMSSFSGDSYNSMYVYNSEVMGSSPTAYIMGSSFYITLEASQPLITTLDMINSAVNNTDLQLAFIRTV